MTALESPTGVPIETRGGKPCDCHDVRIIGALHTGWCIRHQARSVQIVTDGAHCLLRGSASGMAAEVATAIGAPASAVRVLDVREDHARGGAIVTVEIFAPYTEEVARRG